MDHSCLVTAQVFRHSEALFTTVDVAQKPPMGPFVASELNPRRENLCAF